MFKDSGPPKIDFTPMLPTENQCVDEHKEWKLRYLASEAFKDFDEKLDTDEESSVFDDIDVLDGSDVFGKSLPLSCIDCGDESNKDLSLVNLNVHDGEDNSSPARQVINESSNTTLVDGKAGGHCLDDSVEKVLKFQTHAVHGDLKQVCASIKLIVDRWHIQPGL